MSVRSARLTCHGVQVPGLPTLAQCSHPRASSVRGTSLAVTVIATGVIDSVVLLDVGLGIHLTGLLAMLVVAAWQCGHRRNQSKKMR